MSEASVATLTRFFELVSAGEMASALKLMHPRCVVSEASGLPYGGDYVGPQGFIDLFAAIAQDFELKVNSSQVREAGDVVIAEMTASLRAKKTGELLDTAIIEFYRFTDGQISGIDVFYKDTKAVADLANGVISKEPLPYRT